MQRKATNTPLVSATWRKPKRRVRTRGLTLSSMPSAWCGITQPVNAVVKSNTKPTSQMVAADGAAGGRHRKITLAATTGVTASIQGRRRPQGDRVRSLHAPTRGSVSASQIRPAARIAPTRAGGSPSTSVPKARPKNCRRKNGVDRARTGSS
jgi:hypothetical protein